MKKTALLILSALVAAANADTSTNEKAAPKIAGKLRWNNGETISGELIEASATEATWKTPLFQDPLLLRWTALRRIDQPLAAVPVGDAFTIALRDGSHVYGDIVSMTETAVSIHSARHGDAVLKRAEVLSVRRIRGGNLITAGPVGDVGWDVLANRKVGGENKNTATKAVVSGFVVAGKTGTADKKKAPTPPPIPTLVAGPDGALAIPYWNRDAFLELALPELADVEFRVKSSARPEFQFSLEGDAKQQVRIETWDDELVLVVGDHFKTIRKVAESEREVALRICWDRKEKKCAVFSAAGEPLIEWLVPEDAESAGGGVVLKNKGRDLSLELLRVRTWDGKAPPKVDLSKPRLELADGRIVEGIVSGGAAEAVKLRDSELSFPLAEIDAVIFSNDPPKTSEAEAALSFADGTLLQGKIAAIKDGRATMEVAFSEEPLNSRMDALRQLRVSLPAPAGTAAEAPFPLLDKMVVEGTTLHGKLAAAGDASPRWLPVGGVRPALPARTAASEFTRAFPPGAEVPGAPALFYMSTGDVLPGNLRGFDKSGVELESSFFETTKFSPGDLNAIQFGAIGRINVQGFGDPGWRVLKGTEKTVRKTNETLGMDAETSIGHPSAMQSDEIKFDFGSGNNFSTVRLRLFCAGTDPSKSTNLIVAHFGSQVYAGLETSDGQMDDRTNANIPANQSVAVKLVIHEKDVELQFNGVMSQRIPLPPEKRFGAGLIIEPGSMFGNQVSPISLSGFSAPSVPGRAWLPDVSAETKTQALTVPRFRRDDPPRHALLAANGDVLRGEIEAATATHFGFRAGLENLRVPRDRVKAAIWLKKPEADAPPSVPINPLMKRLEQKIGRNTRYNADVVTLIGFIQREVPDLKFKLPEKRDERRMAMSFRGQSIAEALDQICSMFGLRYRIDATNTIIVETLAQVPKGLVQKVYWLNAAAFPKTPVAQEILAGKGIPFPPGATALWQPNAGQLSMTNTAENQAKLAPILEEDFGGSLGSPTHWLLLTSGARIGFAVEKFEDGFVTGHHPIYGRCKVPMSEVYTIRTSSPEPTAAMRSLEDWRLVFAPEPVLPETGGESSPMLGKAAKSFKLALLGGGDFDLAKESGKVVVLDFWATWCGPCIKSLPGLIEAMSAFPADRVKLIGMNQSEPPEQVKRFLETRGWKLTVALDAGQNVAKQYGVEGIPHTVIVGPDGKVAWVKTGYSPEGEAEASAAVKKLLEAP